MRLGFLKNLFGGEKLPAKLRYEDARAALESRSLDVKRELAARRDAPPETLYYLAGDPDASVRALVAGNPATPFQADENLGEDEEGDVRAELARKIARAVPDMAAGEVRDVRNRVVTLLERLARDELARIVAIRTRLKAAQTQPLSDEQIALAAAQAAERRFMDFRLEDLR